MKPYTCMIVDDEDLARELLEHHICQIEQLDLIASCSSAIEARRFLEHSEVDLLLLDIEMPVLKGTDFLKTLSTQPAVIFTTAHRDYAFDGFELNAIDYLLKPITFHRFLIAVEKLFSRNLPPLAPALPQDPLQAYLFVKENRKQIKLDLNQLLYIRSLKDYVEIHLANKQKHVVKTTLVALLEKLDRRFLRVHRSFAVNLTAISAFTKHELEIGTTHIPIGDQYKKALFKNLRLKTLDT